MLQEVRVRADDEVADEAARVLPELRPAVYPKTKPAETTNVTAGITSDHRGIVTVWTQAWPLSPTSSTNAIGAASPLRMRVFSMRV